MSVSSTSKLAPLYEKDETAWLDAMAQLIRDGHHDELDFENLEEFLTSMARRDRREVFSRLRLLLSHRLKWDHQPGQRTRSWLLTWLSQQSELQTLLESQTLRNHAEAVLSAAYARAVKEASAETELPESAFPTACPYTVEQLLTESLSS